MPDRARIAIFVGDDYEDMELWYPRYRLLEAGFEVVVAGLEKKTFRGKNGYPCPCSTLVTELDGMTLGGVILAGGWMPDKLRRDPTVLEIIRQVHGRGKLVGAICHGGWMAISAGVYRGIKVTGSPGIKDDLANAGASFVDAPVVIDRNHVSSRKPDDLPDFMRGVLQVLAGS
jgi:protease I